MYYIARQSQGPREFFLLFLSSHPRIFVNQDFPTSVMSVISMLLSIDINRSVPTRPSPTPNQSMTSIQARRPLVRLMLIFTFFQHRRLIHWFICKLLILDKIPAGHNLAAGLYVVYPRRMSYTSNPHDPSLPLIYLRIQSFHARLIPTIPELKVLAPIVRYEKNRICNLSNCRFSTLIWVSHSCHPQCLPRDRIRRIHTSTQHRPSPKPLFR